MAAQMAEAARLQAQQSSNSSKAGKKKNFTGEGLEDNAGDYVYPETGWYAWWEKSNFFVAHASRSKLPFAIILSENDAAPVGCAVSVVNEAVSDYLKLQGTINAEAERIKPRKKMEELQKQKELKKLKAAQKAKAIKLQHEMASDFAFLPEKVMYARISGKEGILSAAAQAALDSHFRNFIQSPKQFKWLEKELKKLKAAQKAEAAKLQVEDVACLALRRRKNNLKSRHAVVPVSGFSFSGQQIWKIIKENKDLDLPAHKVIVTTVFCEEIVKEKCGSFLENKEWRELQKTVQPHPVPDLEGSLVQFLTLICQIKQYLV
ncbi:hypothetical protein ACH5RR_024848 [Cinchona calisaya]|uniref:Uncharacterized protein n=1 Tax=Cinchona calisaya TaxID=153742 RepID=A0ABD2YYR4_9GENT